MRTAHVERKTQETEVRATVNLDGNGLSSIDTGSPFLDHMLDQLARHGLFDIEITARGDTHIDDHHTVEDVGITLGEAFRQALGDKRGIARFGSATIPLDEALSRVVIDLSNRATLVWQVEFKNSKIGQFDTELFREWFTAFANHSRSTIHVANLYGSNDHHKIESCFKALALALRRACVQDPRRGQLVPSTKGILSDS
ncbi:imidazoleglycerol-phosphate dehydratase HisB [Candidatus Magnetaquicoccus inordinatus]|uniref:imidazoleglycerol-phosphate dehydratase HisB n=1 Tax=Candidatus Magnetaquicoccus inordinatus TaxID=2496818 RepID=UPI00102CB3FE